MYPCNQCEYSASALKNHIKTKLKGIRYPGAQCEPTASTASNLRKRIKSKHEGVSFLCESVNIPPLQKII